MTFKLKDPGSAITHFIGMMMALLATIPLLVKAAREPDWLHLIALSVFALSMFLLYTASTTYHSLDISAKVNRRLQKVDHMMIFVLIAGSYTPVCMIILGGRIGYTLLALVWGIAVAGIIVNGHWITCPKWFSSIIYIAMGWTCLPVFARLWTDLPHAAFSWLLAGGIVYTIGGVIYALKLPVFNALHKYFGSHEIFHLFVMGGSVCHFIFMYHYVI